VQKSGDVGAFALQGEGGKKEEWNDDRANKSLKRNTEKGREVIILHQI
jgi:hypothetical protein